jgi:hypothetical protein
LGICVEFQGDAEGFTLAPEIGKLLSQLASPAPVEAFGLLV